VLRGLVGAAGGSIAGAWLRVGRARADNGRSRVVVVTDGRIWSGPGWTNADLDADLLRSALAQALVALTGAADIGAALAELFPSLSDAAQRYGVKVNCVNADLPTHPAVVAALAGLVVEAGARAENVIAFDRTDRELEKCGFAIGSGDGYRALGCDHDGVGYDEAWASFSDGDVRFSRMLTERIDHLVSAPVLKNHEMAGVTLSLKNHFGSIDDPGRLHGRANDCSPGIGELNAEPRLRGLTRLVVIDAMFGTYESGLASLPDFAPMSLVVATDPVAADTVGQALINQRRQQAGLDAIDARHLHDAAGLGLGHASLAEIERVDILINPVQEKAKPWEGGGGCSATSATTVGSLAAVAGAAALVGRRKGS